MKAEVYRLEICEGVMDMVHGMSRDIEEYYVPSLKMAINCEDDEVHCFTTEADRYEKAEKIGEVNIPMAVIEAGKRYVAAKKELEKLKKWITIDRRKLDD